MRTGGGRDERGGAGGDASAPEASRGGAGRWRTAVAFCGIGAEVPVWFP